MCMTRCLGENDHRLSLSISTTKPNRFNNRKAADPSYMHCQKFSITAVSQMALSRPVLVCFVAAILLMCLGVSYCDEAPSCTTVVSQLVPCLTYLRDGKNPSAACCVGVKAMAAEAKTKQDRTDICKCIQKALVNVKYEPSLIPTLPKKCSVSVDLPPIDQKTDCSKAMNPDYLA